MKRNLIFAVVGQSGTGKTTMAKMLSEKLHIPTIVSYTTRPRRHNEEDGVDHYFVDGMPPKECMLAHTVFGDYDYWTLHTQLVPGPCVYVIDEKGLADLRSEFGGILNICSMLIKRPYDELVKEISPNRLTRDEERMKLPETDYDIVINNDGTLAQFYRKAIQSVKEVIEEQEEYENRGEWICHYRKRNRTVL